MAEEVRPAADPHAEAEIEVPEDLSLLYFLRRKDLADCKVRLPPRDASEGEQLVPCHRLALCAASGYFFRRLMPRSAPAAADQASDPTVDLPVLPDDAEVRRQVDFHSLFPIVLRFIYSDQRWESIEPQVITDNAFGLFALATLLDIQPLAQRAFQYLDAFVLRPETAARLLHCVVQLAASSANVLAGPRSRCEEALRKNFQKACEPPEALTLLCRLPVDILAPILEADDLEVLAEAAVLDVVRRVLRERPIWRPAEVQEPPAEADAAQAPVATATPPPGALSEGEASRILGAIRFPHLEHKELLAAVKDPLLVEAGAQQRILEALSSRLGAYERVEGPLAPAKEPRPSTRRGARGASQPQLSAPKAPPPDASLKSRTLPAGGAPGLAAATRRAGAGYGASAGSPLFPCEACNMGSLLLKQRDLRWCVECSRNPNCPHGILLPSCVAAAVVDGHCAACTLRLGADVRTLSIRVGHQHTGVLLRLPGGVDTLRGMCVAGCSKTLQLLGE